jgi:hypothetical protein
MSLRIHPAEVTGDPYSVQLDRTAQSHSELQRHPGGGVLDPSLPVCLNPGTITSHPAGRPALAYASERSLRFAKNLMSTDPTPPDARCAIDLDPLERGTTVGPGERPSHLPNSGRTHNSLDPQTPRPMYPQVRDDALRSNMKMLDRRSE